MKRTIASLVAVIAAAGLATTAVAQGRHDEKPHGFDAKVAAEQMTASSATTYVTLPTGPRAHDNPLRGKKIALAQPRTNQGSVTPSARRSNDNDRARFVRPAPDEARLV